MEPVLPSSFQIESTRSKGFFLLSCRCDELSLTRTGRSADPEHRPYVISHLRPPLGLSEVLSDSISNSIEHSIVRHLIQISEVVEVYFTREDNVIDVWTIVSVRDRRVRHAVYEKELKIMQELPGLFLNFRISSLEGASVPASAGYRRVDVVRTRSNAKH
jgi:hypothetical protein